MVNILQILRSIFKFSFVNLLLKINKKIYLDGNYSNWQEALNASKTNYLSKKITNKIKHNFSRSLKYDNFYERDGILLKKDNQTKDNIINHYKKYCSKNNRIFRILDFGGGTGTIFFKNQEFFHKNQNIKWYVYDQSQIISFVKKKIFNQQIKFISKLSTKDKNKFQIILLQSSLQYFPRPYNLLDKLIELNSKFIIVDETPLTKNKFDEIMVQKNPKKIYPIDYPIHIFSKEKIINYFEKKKYKLLYDKKCTTGIGGYNYKCLSFVKK